MYNKPSGTTGNISLGPGILYLGASGATPTFDIGYVTGDATINFKREALEIRQGSPQTIITQFAKQEDIMFETKGIEWNMDALQRALGDGATSVSGADRILKVGGTPNFNTLALQFVHKAADGGTITLNLWKVVADGQIDASIGNDKNHEFKMKFKAIDPGTTDWAGAALTDGQKLFKLSRTIP